jgi:hypothetical protein
MSFQQMSDISIKGTVKETWRHKARGATDAILCQPAVITQIERGGKGNV